MNKTAIKNYAIWARNKLIADITYKAGLMGVSEKGIAAPLPQSTREVQFFDIGTKDYASIHGDEIQQRESFISAIKVKERDVGYAAAFRYVVEKAAYTWFNRLAAIRFMEVNDYLPSHVRVLSSENPNKAEPDMVTRPFDTDMEFTQEESDFILALKDENRLDELFRWLFIRQCYKLHEVLPLLFDARRSNERRNDYMELLLTISFTDKDGVLWRLVHDIKEKDFRIRTPEDDERQRIENIPEEDMPAGQVEIIGWLYQYYNTEPKDQVFADLKKNIKISKDKIPAATQLFTPDWIVRYMVENSLGRLWVEGHPDERLKKNWKYYLEEAEQEPKVQAQLAEIRKGYAAMRPEEIKVIDPCMGSGHILVYLFDVLMQIYESQGWTQREAAQSIVQNNLFGLDIDERAAQLAYFAVMMKARQYDRRFLTRGIVPHVYDIRETNDLNPDYLQLFGDLQKKAQTLFDELRDAKTYGSILKLSLTEQDLAALLERLNEIRSKEYDNFFDSARRDGLLYDFPPLLDEAVAMVQKYDVVVTNPPYLSGAGMDGVLTDYVKKNFPNSKSDLFSVFIERCSLMTRLNGYHAMITMQSWMFLKSYEKMRMYLLKNEQVVSLLYLGIKAFEEIGNDIVQTAAFIIRRKNNCNYHGNYFKLLTHDRQQKISDYLSRKALTICPQSSLFKVPGAPIAFWVSERFRDSFSEKSLDQYADIRSGMSTTDNERFLRYWFEPSIHNINFSCTSLEIAKASPLRWYPYNKGGDYRKWYGNNSLVVNWLNDGAEIKTWVVSNPKDPNTTSWSRRIFGTDCFFKAGVTWSSIASSQFGCRDYGIGFIFDSGANGLFPFDSTNKLYFIGLLNSKVAKEVLDVINPSINFGPGTIGKIPTIISSEVKAEVEQLVSRNIMLAKEDWDDFETSWDFKVHPLLSLNALISKSFETFEQRAAKRYSELKANEERINSIFISLYGLEGEVAAEIEDRAVSVRKANMLRETKSLISYAVGCIMGRYSLDCPGLVFAGGAWNSNDYTTFIPDVDNCIPITDEEYFEDDIVGRFVEFIRAVFGEKALEENLSFIANVLGNKGNSSREVIRNYFLNDFIKDHIKIYQKRPIYWLFDSGKQNGFKALVYMHRWDADTVGNLRVEYLHRMQRVYEKEIDRMQDIMDNSHNNREINQAAKRREKLVKQLKETRDYDAKIAHAALSRVEIDLDNGVKANYEKVQKGPDGKSLNILAKI